MTRHGFPIVACEHTFDQAVVSRLRKQTRSPILNSSIRACARICAQKTQTFDDPVVQVDELSFTQPIDIDLCHFATVC